MHCPTSSDNLYFANNKQASLALTPAFCFAHAKHNLIKLKYIIIDQGRVLCEIQTNQSNSSPLNISQSINVE